METASEANHPHVGLKQRGRILTHFLLFLVRVAVGDRYTCIIIPPLSMDML